MSLTATIHPNDRGPRFIHGKTYYWGLKNGRLSLLLWPDDAEGKPAQYHLLPHLPEEMFT